MKSSSFITTVRNDVMMVVFWTTLVSVTTVQSQPTADFDADHWTSYAPLTVVFTDKSINAVTWTWYFPGANPFSLTGAGPHTVTFPEVKTYEVTLEVMDVTGYTDSKSKYITVLKGGLDFGDAPDDQAHFVLP